MASKEKPQVALAKPIAVDTPWWESREKLDLIKHNVCPQGIPDGEFAVAMEKCRRLGADPLSDEVYITKRNVNIGTRDEKKWVTKYQVQMAEKGMASRAERFSDFVGINGAVIYEGDDILIDNASGQVVKHLTNPVKQTKVLAAWAQVERKGKKFPVDVVRLSEYIQDQGLWAKPHMMLWKCARAAALRRAFPEAFAGIYSLEELPEASERSEPPAGWPVGKSSYEVATPAPQVVLPPTTENPFEESPIEVEASPVEVEAGAQKWVDEIRTLLLEEKLKETKLMSYIRENVPESLRYEVAAKLRQK